jgi:GDPmannose 4,6-dehydratase
VPADADPWGHGSWGGCTGATNPSPEICNGRDDDCDGLVDDGLAARQTALHPFEHVGLDWQKYVKFDERYLRPTEVDALVGDASRANAALDWTPKIHAPELARIMVDADIEALDAAGRPWIDTVVKH